MTEDYSEAGFVAENREIAARPKRKRAEAMPTLIDYCETATEVVQRLVRDHHHHLAAANILVLCTNKPIKHNIKVQKSTPILRYLTSQVDYPVADEDRGADFIITVSLESWNQWDERLRAAMLDHVLTRCEGVENEENGEMKWSLRDPQVQVFPEVVERYGCYTPELDDLRNCVKEPV